jgi:hypothetical protein
MEHMSEFRDPRALTPADSPWTLDDVRASAAMRDLATPKVAEGDAAADFTLAVLHPAQGDPPTITLSAFAGIRPVALIFGSYT